MWLCLEFAHYSIFHLFYLCADQSRHWKWHWTLFHAAHFPLSDKWTRFWTYVRGMMNVQNHNWIDYYCSCSFHIWPLIARYVWYRLPGVHRCHHYIYIRMAIVLKFKPLTTTYIHSADVIFFSRVTAKSIWIERSLFRILAHIVSTHCDCTKVASFMHVP